MSKPDRGQVKVPCRADIYINSDRELIASRCMPLIA